MQIFKGKKLCYPASIPLTFTGDHIGLDSDKQLGPKWQKFKQGNPQIATSQILFAAVVKKINRSDGAEAGRVLVLTPSSLLVCVVFCLWYSFADSALDIG